MNILLEPSRFAATAGVGVIILPGVLYLAFW